MITLDTGTSEVRIVETNGDTVTSWASLDIEPGIYEDGIVTDPAALGAIMKELFSSSGIKGNRVIASINGLYSLSRILMVPTPPEVPASEEAVHEAVENLLPISPDETYLFWDSIGASEVGHQVIVHAVPKEAIDDLMQAMKIAGITSRTLDLRTMALARAVNCENGIILNIDSETFDIVLVVDGMTEVMRTTAWKNEKLSTTERAEYMVTAVDTTVSFFDSTRPNFPFNKTNPLYITGQMSGDLELVKMIRESMDYAEAVFKPLLDYPEHFPASQYAVNIGLALKENPPVKAGFAGNETPDINLLPKVYQPWKPTPKQIYLSLALFLALVLLFPLYQVTTKAINETETLETQHKSINSLMELRKAEIAKRDPLRKVVDEYNILVNSGGGFIDDYETIMTLANKYDAQLSSITHVGNSISFTCDTENYQIFRDFMDALEESGRFLSPITPPEGYPYINSGSIKLDTNPDI